MQALESASCKIAAIASLGHETTQEINAESQFFMYIRALALTAHICSKLIRKTLEHQTQSI